MTVLNVSKWRQNWRWLGWAYLLFLLVYWCMPQHKLPRQQEVEAYVQTYGPMAVQLSRETGVPHAIILAAGGLESSWGRSELARNGNNHFGIKAYGNETSHCLPTREYVRGRALTVQACFRAYRHPREGFRDYVALLTANPRYADLFAHHANDYEAWAEGLQLSGYATDPRYASKLIRVIKRYRLDDVDG